MKVRCTKLFDSRGASQGTSSWLTIGKVYDVLTIEFERQGQWLIRLIGAGKSGAALFPIDSFDVVSSEVSPSWVASWNSDGFFQLAPEKWTQPGFWEQFYDREPEALALFDEEVARLIE